MRIIIYGILLSPTLIVALQDRQSQCIQPAGSSFNSCQLFSVWRRDDGSQMPITAGTKYNTPLGSRIASERLKTSYTRMQTTKNHPEATLLFFQEPQLATQLNDFLNSVQTVVQEDYEKRFAQAKDDYFIAYFSRIQLTIQHEIYQYLMSIYTAFNMTHVNSIEEYLRSEVAQALNKKTMIVNHLVSIIEAQANQAITMRFPNMPQHLATRMGPMMMQQDYGADLNLMLAGEELKFFEDLQTQKYYQLRREAYYEIFGKYLKFFKNYTATIDQDDKDQGTVFARLAKNIQNVFNQEKYVFNKSGSTKQKVEALRTLKTINPPLFFYDEETMRCLKLIPVLAQDLPIQVQKVPWPVKLVEDAAQAAPITDRSGNVISNLPRAFFLDSNGTITTSKANARQLFVNIPTAENMYTQEVKAQPDWLNSKQGIMLMLRACLGDYIALFDPLIKKEEILDPCLSCIILNSALKIGLYTGSEKDQICKDCDWYLEQLRNLTQPIIQEEPPPPPPLGDIIG